MEKNILVTGSHRSGTTWVGKILTFDGALDNVHEPFNLMQNDIYNTPIKQSLLYVGEDKERQKAIANYLDYFMKGSPKAAMDRIQHRGVKKIPYILSDEGAKFLKRNNRKLVKDPIAIFSADFFYKKLNYDVLVMIRHPAAFALSLKDKQWYFDFSHLLSQTDFMAEVIPHHKAAIEALINDHARKNDIIEQAILLWNIIHERILYYQKNYTDWIFIKHETLSLDPLMEFEKIFQRFDIPFTKKIQQYIAETTSGKSTQGGFVRDSSKNIKKWSTKLSTEEIHRIHQGTKEMAANFYTKKEWFGAV